MVEKVFTIFVIPILLLILIGKSIFFDNPGKGTTQPVIEQLRENHAVIENNNREIERRVERVIDYNYEAERSVDGLEENNKRFRELIEKN